MTGIEILTGVLSTIAVSMLVWGVKQVASFLGIKKDGELLLMIEEYIEKAIDQYDDKLQELINEKGQNVAKHNELVGAVMEWLNDNAPKIIKQFFGKDMDQLESFVSNWVLKKVKSML